MDISNKQALEAADRRLRHAVRESFPIINTTLTAGFAIASAASSGTPQAVMAGVSAVCAAVAIKSVYEDSWFWMPAVSNWLKTHQAVKKSEAATKAQSVAIDRSPE